MEIFGGMAVMAGILGFFLSVVWLVMPFVVFAIKGRVDRAVYLLEEMETHLKALDDRLAALEKQGQSTRFGAGSATLSDESP